MDEIFSPLEQRLIRKITDKPITHGRLAKLMKKSSAVVSILIIRINKKCGLYSLDWYICGEGGVGRGGKSVWKAPQP